MKRAPLGDIVDFYSGGTPAKARPELWDGDVPWFSAKDLKAPRLTDSIDHISESVFATTPLRKLPAGTIAIVVRGMILAHTLPVSILDVDCAINQDLKALIPRRQVEPGYLAAMLRAQAPTILSQVSTAGHGTKKLDSRVLENIEIPLPSLTEQRRIVAILDQADAIHTNRRQILSHLDALPLDVLSGLLNGCHESTQLGDLLVQGPQNGLYLPSSEYGSGTPIVRIDSFRFGTGRLGGQRLRRLRTEPSQISTYGLRVGDLLINRVNSNEHVGKSALVRTLDEPTVFESNLMRITLDQSRAIPEYVIHVLQTSAIRAQIAPMVKPAVNQASVNQGDVRSLLIPSLPVASQRQFAGQVEAIAARRTVVERALAADDELFAALQSRAFRGEL